MWLSTSCHCVLFAELEVEWRALYRELHPSPQGVRVIRTKVSKPWSPCLGAGATPLASVGLPDCAGVGVPDSIFLFFVSFCTEFLYLKEQCIRM